MAAKSQAPIGSGSPFELQLRQQDQVIIHIWSSAENKSIPGANVGHAAVQTPDRYISLWPGPRVRRERGKLSAMGIQQFFDMRPSNWKPSYLEDCVAEALSEEQCREIRHLREREEKEEVVALLPAAGLRLLNRDELAPEGATLIAVTPLHANVRVALYGLNIGHIHTTFTQLQENCPGWRLIGSNFLTRLTNGSGENCASVAYRILNAGGMYAGTLKAKGSSETLSVTTPDMLIRHVMAAKKKEQHVHAETKDWTFDGETPLEALQKAYGELSPPEGTGICCTM